MAAARAREATPPPVIGKAGRYTVFITPPPTPKPSEAPRPLSPSLKLNPSPRPRNVAPLPVRVPSPSLAPALPPVQVPPPQFEKSAARASASAFGFFWNAVARVQDVHSSLDEYLADLFGLNQSKYQWALNDYYENNEKMEGGKGGKPKELTSKGQAV
ncbi:calcium-dependent protein kinase 27-like [Phoenix dactylifera]|uniref:Calcium-dependent protein kinase 27-like n=1 Tax=Phoenix dactylifera TaxID=42345 RepID=A0A8B9AAK9_PHODC|nr:calcium-dependent protein kinase 27-like [Phoenix dactylifera]XP_038983727.1 calcium-dependent protein kinase 27-like [Phoenix dactylifera]